MTQNMKEQKSVLKINVELTFQEIFTTILQLSRLKIIMVHFWQG